MATMTIDAGTKTGFRIPCHASFSALTCPPQEATTSDDHGTNTTPAGAVYRAHPTWRRMSTSRRARACPTVEAGTAIAQIAADGSGEEVPSLRYENGMLGQVL